MEKLIPPTVTSYCKKQLQKNLRTFCTDTIKSEIEVAGATGQLGGGE